MKLTQRVIDGIECPAGKKDTIFFDTEQKGLGVRVTEKGSKSFLVQFTIAGIRRRVPLGNRDRISLAAARDAARSILGQVAAGQDPAAARISATEQNKKKKEADQFTVEKLISDWCALGMSDNKTGYIKEANRALRKAFTAYMDKPAAEIDKKIVRKIHDEMAASGKATTAARIVSYGRAAWNWAIQRETIEKNPFENQPTRKNKSRDRVLNDSEIKEIWHCASPESTFGSIVRMLILTGQRRDEVSGMTWEEVSPDLSTWTIPGGRTKNGVTHIVPISGPAGELIRMQPRYARESDQPDFVFSGRIEGQFKGWSRARANLDRDILEHRAKAAIAAGDDPKAIKPMQHFTLHDLRRTMATGLQRIGVRLEVTEAVLNHISGSRAGIVGIYQRHDFAMEKRAAMDAWARHVMSVVSGAESSENDIPLRSKA